MEIESLIARYSPFLKKYWLPLVLFCLGLIFFVYGLISFLGSASKPADLTFHNSTEASNSTSSASFQNSILVDVEGAVVAPGVYKLAPNSIIQDALVSAEGLASNADRNFVAKNINLAAKLTDGAKVYIPKIGETMTTSSPITNSITGQTSTLINVNTADATTLDSLPGVGPATATKIINQRPYANINELLDKKVVSSKVFSEIKDKITVY